MTRASGDLLGATPGVGQQIPFDGMIAVHRGALRQYRVAAVLLFVAGLLLILLGLVGVLPLVLALVVGVVTAAVSVFPYRDGVERQERIDGLQVLHDEWRGLEGASAEPEQERERFLGLLWKLYDKR